MGTTREKSPKRPKRRAVAPADLLGQVAGALPGFLPSQRWFGSRARSIAGATVADYAPVPQSAGILAMFEITYVDGGKEAYLIPVLPGGKAAPFVDAMTDSVFCLALVEQVRLGARLAGRHGAFCARFTDAFGDILPEPPCETVPIRGEQSNTSVIYDGRAILKLLRRLEPGMNPDYEIADALTRHSTFRGVPRLAGVITYEDRDGWVATLAVLREFVPNQGDAWTATQARLQEYYVAAVEGLGAEQPAGEAFARTLAAADAVEARRLGALTGRLHMALASESLGPDFLPEPIRASDLADWLVGMQSQLDRVMGVVAAALSGLPGPTRDLAQSFLNDAPRLRDDLATLRALEGEGVAKIRVHGDYHLGQVLRSGEEFVIMDFEGEPARPLSERRSKQCALKDVAGMLRSYSYAAQSALIHAAETGASGAGLPARLRPWAEAWEEGVRAGFLEGYLEETWRRGAPFLPRGREALDAALRAFEVDKALYELAYEINHRPAWVRIPLEGLRRATFRAAQTAVHRAQTDKGPFHFVACLELREFVGVRAENERQLAERIEEVPLDSIYYHTHGFFLRHRFVAGTYPNDFATWVAVQVRDRVLGERLAMVEPAEFADLQSLREELVSVIDDHLRVLQIDPGALFGEPFDFIESHIVEIPTGVTVRSLQEFRDALLDIDVSAVYFHLVEARMRLGRGQNDFAAWLERGLGLSRLAARVRAVDPYAGSMERARTRLIQLCDEAIAEGSAS